MGIGDDRYTFRWLLESQPLGIEALFKMSYEAVVLLKYILKKQSQFAIFPFDSSSSSRHK
jgi:hypothetical protein